ncbi:hypothetical protein L1887_32056 [Cichorium endivia]|nr:hypothetical protein L1887_32056 [Cichorium endivia]
MDAPRVEIWPSDDETEATEDGNAQTYFCFMADDTTSPLHKLVVEKAFSARASHDETWYIDSGCSKHMTGHKGCLRDFKEYTASPRQYVTFRNNMRGKVMCHRNITNRNFTVRRVAYVDGLKHNLISVAQLCDNDHQVLFTRFHSLIMDAKSNVLVESKRDGNMYPLDIVLIEGAPDICLLSKASSDISWLLHRRKAC